MPTSWNFNWKAYNLWMKYFFFFVLTYMDSTANTAMLLSVFVFMLQRWLNYAAERMHSAMIYKHVQYYKTFFKKFTEMTMRN